MFWGRTMLVPVEFISQRFGEKAMYHKSVSDFSIVHFLMFSLLFISAICFFMDFLETLLVSLLNWNFYLPFL